MSRGIGAGAVVLLVIVGVALVWGGGFQILPEEGGDGAAPVLELTALDEGTCPTFNRGGGDCATGVGEIVASPLDRKVVLQVVADSSADTLAPDSFAIDFSVRCQGGCDWVDDTALRQSALHARLVLENDWVLKGNTSDVDVVARAAGLQEGERQIGWTDASGTTLLGETDAGALALLGDGEVAALTVAVAFNPELMNLLPDGGQVYVLQGTLEVFSPAGGAPISVSISLELTVNS